MSERQGVAARDLAERTIEGLVRLGNLGEQVEDEWQYVNDLVAVYRGRLLAVADQLGQARVEPDVAAAVDTAIDESELITDPHRAIDWLSTLPQVVLLALGADA